MPPSIVTVGDAIDRYWRSIERRSKHPPPRGLSPLTVQTYRYSLDRLDPLRHERIEDLTVDILSDAFDAMFDRTPSGARASWYQLCIALQNVGHDTPKIFLPRRPQRGRVIRTHEHEQILEVLDRSRACTQHKEVLRLLLVSNLRRGAACHLEWRNVQGRQIRISHDKGITEETAYQIVASEDMLSIIRRQDQSCRWVFGVKGLPPSGASIYALWRNTCAFAGLDPGLRLHDCRHTTATRLSLAGVPDSVIDAQMGYRPKDMIRVYQHPAQLPSHRWADARQGHGDRDMTTQHLSFGPNVRTVSVDVASAHLRAPNVGTLARALSKICRYAGACPSFYSVAEHSVMVADRLWALTKSHRSARAGLLHDAVEILTGDIPSPTKSLFPEVEAFERRVLESWLPCYDAHDVDFAEVDLEVQRLELRAFCGDARVRVLCLAPAEAEQLFLRRAALYQVPDAI
jgi:integrase